jgi:sugar lactone lactonase YvrE
MIALACACAAFAAGLAAGSTALAAPFIGPFTTVTPIGSTVPANGDLNPYGIANVTRSRGALVRGDILISNFNDAANLQGTGTTLVQVSPSGRLSLFAHIDPTTLPGPCPGGVGLTTALTILPQGFVVVGSLPTENGKAATAQAGCLIVLDSNGNPVETISGPPINGPWDMTSFARGANSDLFVTNVLNGTLASGETPVDEGTVVRIHLHTNGPHIPQVTATSVIAQGFPERTDEAALVIGPTGVALGDEGTLYVADTLGNRIAAIPDALTRQTPIVGGGATVAAGGSLNSPLGLTLAPNGDILTANAGDGNLVETTPAGAELQTFDTGAGGGGLFGLTVAPDQRGVYFVDDTTNELDLLH